MKKFSELFEVETAVPINGFCILKPEFMNFNDAWITLLKNNGWNIVQQVKKTLTLDQAKALYKPHSKEPFYNDLCDYMCSGDCVCCSCYKDCKDPIKDMDTIKQNVRKVWGKDEMKNAMHSSDSLDNVKRESNICFLQTGDSYL